MKEILFVCILILLALTLNDKAQNNLPPLSPVPVQNPANNGYTTQIPPLEIDPKIQKEYEKAKKNLAKIDAGFKKNSLDGSSYYKRGVARANVGMREAAIKDFTRAIELLGDHAGSYFYRGRTYYYNDEYEEALSDLNKSIELKNDYAESFVVRGLTLWELDKEKEAFADFTRAIELDPKNAKAYEWRSMLYDKDHETESNADYQKYLELTDEP